jgi:hydrogenase expression/formation protein HypE
MKISLAHGSGGRLTHDLIKNFLKKFDNPSLSPLADSAILNEGLAFTTDSFVVKPIFFPGGDIGKLAVTGTVNDLSVMGAKPLYISCGLIIEEGLDYEILEKIIESMATTAKHAGVEVVTGDTKVVEKGKCDGIFINTAGIGLFDGFSNGSFNGFSNGFFNGSFNGKLPYQNPLR